MGLRHALTRQRSRLLKAGIDVFLDPHDYGYEHGTQIGSNAANAAFADFWGKLAGHFSSTSNVLFGLMNEPNAVSATQWIVSVNAAKSLASLPMPPVLPLSTTCWAIWRNIRAPGKVGRIGRPVPGGARICIRSSRPTASTNRKWGVLDQYVQTTMEANGSTSLTEFGGHYFLKSP
jgi:hypothetical protein